MGICISACTSTHLEPLDAMDTFSTTPDDVHQTIDDDVEEMIIVALGRQYTAVGTVGSNGVDAPFLRHRAPSSTGESTGNLRDEEEATNPLHVSSRERELRSQQNGELCVNFGLEAHASSSAGSDRCLEDASVSSECHVGQGNEDPLHSTDSGMPPLVPCNPRECVEDESTSYHSSQCSGGLVEPSGPHPCLHVHDEHLKLGAALPPPHGAVQPFSEALFHIVHYGKEEEPLLAVAPGAGTSSSSRKSSSKQGSRSSSTVSGAVVPPSAGIDLRHSKGSGGLSPLAAVFCPAGNHRSGSRHHSSNAAHSGNSDHEILIQREENFAEPMLPAEYTNSNYQSSNLFAHHQSDRSQGGSSVTSMDPTVAIPDSASVLVAKDGDTMTSKYSAPGRSRRDTVQSLLSKSSTGSVADAMMMEPTTPRLLDTPKDTGAAHISPFHFEREAELGTLPLCDQPSVGNVKLENIRKQRSSLEMFSVVRIQSANNKSSSNRSPCCDEE